MKKQEVCYTYETALEKAIEMKRESHKAYKSAYFKINDPRVKAFTCRTCEHKPTVKKKGGPYASTWSTDARALAHRTNGFSYQRRFNEDRLNSNGRPSSSGRRYSD